MGSEMCIRDRHFPLQVFAHFLNDDRLGEFGQYKQQYDGPKRTADDVQEGQAEDFYVSSFFHVDKGSGFKVKYQGQRA